VADGAVPVLAQQRQHVGQLGHLALATQAVHRARAHHAGQAGLVVAVDADGRPAQRRGQVREAGVQADDGLRAGQHGRHVAHLQERRHVAVAARGDALGQRLLDRAAPQHHGLPAPVVQPLADRDPARSGHSFSARLAFGISTA
jgi:hypothetical protein